MIREKNSVARQHNVFINDGRSSLSPLSSVRTGELIEDFPEDLDDMDRLPSEFATNAMLLCLRWN